MQNKGLMTLCDNISDTVQSAPENGVILHTDIQQKNTYNT